MNCLEFERLLDTGALDALPAEARAHADECAHCARSLVRAQTIERQLMLAFSPEQGAPVTLRAAGDALPAGFTARVMARVALGEARGVRAFGYHDALPWWVRVASEPSVVLAAGLSALLVWKGDALIALTSPDGVANLGRGLAFPTPPAEVVALTQALSRLLVPGPQVHWSVAAGVLLGLAPVLGLVAWLLWRAGERLVLPVRAHHS
ncbi:MAG: hypothetical protein ABL977_13885 [Candidatus Eisenbacteria bacterium]